MGVLFSIALFFLAVVIHEFAHGWVAYKLGDPTAKHSGRLTLNPLAHIDPVGTIILPLFLIITHSPILFGWAKPVPVNFLRLNHPKKDMIWVGLAGPIANILVAVIISILIKLDIAFMPILILRYFLILNLFLAVFNLMPIPPLDGSRVVLGMLPSNNLAFKYMQLEQFGFIIIVIMLYLGILDHVIWPIVMAMLKFLL
ncbi:MAG: site-2 protease family protein [Candidatus Omnitrophica bacterium]|nr:site-2 protease family protein [Candidatus Omnitrophota bacterium]